MKQSKSKGNGTDPIDVVNEIGADCMRLSLLFYGPNESAV